MWNKIYNLKVLFKPPPEYIGIHWNGMMTTGKYEISSSVHGTPISTNFWTCAPTQPQYTLNKVPQRHTIDDLAQPLPMEELAEALRQLRNSKAAGMDGVPAEIWKICGVVLLDHLHQLLSSILEQQQVPQ